MFAIAVLILINHACDVSRQASQAINLARCEFRVRDAQNIRLAGISIQNVSSLKNLNLGDAAKVMAAMGSSTLPLTLTLIIEAKNPNLETAGLNRLEWILFIDDIQMTLGVIDQAIAIPPNNVTTVIPVQVGMDLKKALEGKSLEAIMNFGFNLAGVGSRPTRIKVKLKPTIMVGSRAITYPGYITVRTDFTGL
jgi:LEA14-like dessication related protein